ncbi:MAG TPA: tetratricopeptide repeat protein [Steroidobacteraceae bacterium]|nr:tetratricopeptide repeat protein [Steroidobacteraceae bacterium]
MQRGRAYFAQGDFTHASVEFRNAMQIAPKDVTARLMQARTAEKLGQIRDAAGLYQSVLDLQPDNLEAQAGLGRLFVFGGAPERGLKTVAPGLKAHPDTPALLLVRSVARSKMNDPVGATQDAERALQLAPDNEDALGLRAGLYQSAGDPQQAEALLNAALKRLPQSVQLREVLFNLYIAAGERGPAEEQLQALIKLQPRVLRYRQQLALLYAQNHRIEDAQRVLEEAVTASPQDTATKLELVSFLATQRNSQQAQARLQEFIAREPDNYDLRFGLAELQQRTGEDAAALSTYREIVARAGRGAKGLLARDRIAAMELQQGHEAQALEQVEEVLRLDPRDTEALLVRGELALRRQDPVAAIADLRAVVRDQPTSAPLQRLLARAYLANGETALSEQALRAALDQAPNDLQARVQLADLLLRTQRPQPAVALLEEAVQHAPTEALPREALVNAYLATHDFKSAARAAADLLTLRPNDSTAFYLVGLADRAQNDPSAALTNFKRAHELAPRAIEPLSALAQLYVSQGERAQAITLVQQVVTDTAGKDAVPVNLLGELYLSAKDLHKASEAFTQATQAAPRWWLPYRNLALVRLAANDSGGAVNAYESALQLAPQQPELIAELAQIYEHSNRVGDAVNLYEGLLRQQPKSEFAANNLAMLLVTYRTDKASLDRARDLTAGFASSASGSLLDTAGWVRFKRGEYREALPVLERATALAPGAKEIRFHLAMAQLQAGERAQARANLETALAGAGTAAWSGDARAALAGLKDRTG